MCGIAGLIDPRGGAAGALADQVRAMAATLRHRGPDDEGLWVEAAAGVALGHRRLSIIDLSALGHQPMESADRQFVAVFNGEIYNYPALRAGAWTWVRRFAATPTRKYCSPQSHASALKEH
jgi:asparagine synthase (glutamine-hydrolysing)